MQVLAIDTSNQTMSIALVNDEKVLGAATTNVNKNHSEGLMPAVNELLSKIQVKLNEIDRFVVAQGPGSYTGLRIGVTAAKMFASTLGKELVGVSSLATLAANVPHLPAEILRVPVFDARRENVYTAAYSVENGALKNILPAKHCGLDEWLEELAKQGRDCYFLGDDVAKFQNKITTVLKEKALFALPQENCPNAVALAYLGMKKDPVTAIDGFVPIYLKKTQAEEEWLKTHPNQKETNYVEQI